MIEGPMHTMRVSDMCVSAARGRVQQDLSRTRAHPAMPRLSTLLLTGELRFVVLHSLKHRQHPARLSDLSNACGCGATAVATALCPWLLVADRGATLVAQVLIARGASANAQDERNNTALHLATDR